MNKKDTQYIDRKLVEEDKIESLDMFKVNLVNLNNIWYNNSYDIVWINNIDLYKLLGSMIKNSRKSKIIVIMPMNQKYYYFMDSTKNSYLLNKELKKIIPNLKLQLKEIFGENQINYNDFYYENTETKIKNKNIKASFHFKVENAERVLKSIGSEKITAVLNKNLIFTTLDINEENFLDFIDEFLPELTQENDNKPEWFSEIEFFDDKENRERIEDENTKILESKRIIEEKQTKLIENDYYKSILYSNGDQLVEVVFSILEKILNYDLKKFIDNKKEDFLLKFDDITFVGEIKGIGTGVKSGNISQVDRHLQDYFDKLQEEEMEENLKGILIINPQRSVSPSNREKVHETQIKLAERNECLIILTEDLLRLYEKFLTGEVATEKILEIFKCEIGLFSMN